MRVRLALTVAVLALYPQMAAAKAVTIEYWGLWGQPYRDIELEAVNRFNKLNEGRIFVKAVDMGAGSEQKVLTALAGGVGPECFKLDRFMTGSWAAKNVIVSIDPYIKKDKLDPSIFFAATWAESIYDGKVYGLPWNTDNRVMYYNKTLFKQVGLDPESPPATWDAMDMMGRKIDQFDGEKYLRVGIIPHFGNWGFLGWLYAAGGDLTNVSGKTIAWDSPQGLKAAQLIAGTIQRYGGEQAVNGFRSFTSGKVGAAMEGSWFLKETLKRAKNIRFDYGVAVPPRPASLEVAKTTWSGGFSLCIPKGCKHPQEAWSFIKFMTTVKENQLALAVGSSQIPALKAAAYDEKVLANDPHTQRMVDLMGSARFRPVLPAGEEMARLYRDELLNLLVTGKKSPQDALKFTATEAQKVLDRAWSRIR